MTSFAKERRVKSNVLISDNKVIEIKYTYFFLNRDNGLLKIKVPGFEIYKSGSVFKYRLTDVKFHSSTKTSGTYTFRAHKYALVY